jgi:hypothetical protein
MNDDTSTPGAVQILLVHGTKLQTGDEESEPSTREWWNKDHEFHKHLEKMLGEEERPYEISTFEWNGSNSEATRRKSARKLRRRLLKWERSKTRYHIVAHSHGGSVLWHALARSAIWSQLRCLVSWTTVGTPFLHFRVRLTPLMYLVAIAFVTMLLVQDVFGARTFVAEQTVSFLRDFRDTLSNLYHGKHTAIVPALAGTAYCVVWLYVAYRLVMITALPVVRFSALLLQMIRERRAWKIYQARWKPLYSRKDEAILGLYCIVDPPDQKIFRIPSAPGLRGFLINLALFPIRLVFNPLIAPVLDLMVSRRIVNRLHGADIPGLRLATVDRSPRRGARPTPLPREFDEELIARANDSAGEALGKIRDILGEDGDLGKDATNTVEKVTGWLAKIGLVHTSYFDSELIRDRIRQGVTGSNHSSHQSRPRLQNLPQSRHSFLELTGHILGLAAAAIVLASLHALNSALNLEFSQLGMREHAVENRPVLREIISSDTAFKLEDGFESRLACRGWLRTLVRMGKTAAGLADAKILKDSRQRAWVACTMFAGLKPGRKVERQLCVSALEEAFSIVHEAGISIRPDRQMLAMNLQSVMCGCLLSQLEGAAYDPSLAWLFAGEDEWSPKKLEESLEHVHTDLRGLLRAYGALLFTLQDPEIGWQPNRWLKTATNPAGEYVSETRRVAAFTYGCLFKPGGDKQLLRDLLGVIDASIQGSSTGEVAIDRTLLAGMDGVLRSDPNEVLNELIDRANTASDKTATTRVTTALELASITVYLSPAGEVLKQLGQDDAGQKRLEDQLVRMADLASELLDRTPSPLSNKLRSRLALANLIAGWSHFELRRAGLTDDTSKVEDSLRRSGTLATGIEHSPTQNSLLAKTAVIWIHAKLDTEYARETARLMKDVTRGELKIIDIENIAAMVRNPGDKIFGLRELLVERARKMAESKDLDHLAFAAKLAKRIPDQNTRSATLLFIAKRCAESIHRPFARELISSCTARHQAEFWAEAIHKSSDDQ